jgi:DNA-binding GntR family transcriptional regulator
MRISIQKTKYARETMMVDPKADRAVYKQLADLIRTQIENGEFAPGQRLPAQKDYMHEHGLSRDSVERAMAVLRTEGAIVTDRRGSRVRPDHDRTIVHVPSGKVHARIPTEPERRHHDINEGVPVLVVTRDSAEEIYPADQIEIWAGDAEPD